jgi:putative spermidine/putrescine transport system substrate-binding protein
VLSTPAGVERAFAKLRAQTLHPVVGRRAQPAQWLAAGDGDDLDLQRAHRCGPRSRAARWPVWPGSLYGMDYWAIIKGSRHVDQAKRLIAYANQPDTQVRYVQQILWADQHPGSRSLTRPWPAGCLRRRKPGALAMNVEFWVDHGEELAALQCLGQ